MLPACFETPAARAAHDHVFVDKSEKISSAGGAERRLEGRSIAPGLCLRHSPRAAFKPSLMRATEHSGGGSCPIACVIGRHRVAVGARPAAPCHGIA